MVNAAVIFEGSPFDRKGLFNAVQNRISHLVDRGMCNVDAYCIHSWDTAFTRKMRHTPYVAEKQEHVTVEGIPYRMLWYDFSIFDYLTIEKLYCRPLLFSRFINRTVSMLKGYDVIVAHSFTGALVAYHAHVKYGIPYYVTWHGSDIHTHPIRNVRIRKDTCMVMEAASCNFFVSKALMCQSDSLTVNAEKEVLYNGISDGFACYPDEKKKALRTGYGLSADDKVVAFVGSIVAVKNVHILQPLFHAVRSMYSGNLKFWMVGDGKLRDSVEPVLMADESIDVKFWGNVHPQEMPEVMNCIDVMVLPSHNEGLPLVCAEAVRCGANVVGADVGGIPEVIGHEYVVPHGDGFVDAMAGKVVELLKARVHQSIPEDMDWEKTAGLELEHILKC